MCRWKAQKLGHGAFIINDMTYYKSKLYVLKTRTNGS